MSEIPSIAIIGGTGLYAIDELIEAQKVALQSEFGPASDAAIVGRFGGRLVAFLARHGSNHTIAPHRVNYRANIDGLRRLGVRQIIAVNAVGGIGADFGPQVLAIPHQLIDYTHGRLSSFSDMHGRTVEHVDFSEPYSATMRAALIAAAHAQQLNIVPSGIYGVTQGPRLETAAEIARMRRDGCDLVGMTGMPEAVLAREAQLEYASVCVTANWAAGAGDAQEITMEEIFANLRFGMQKVRQLLLGFLRA
jgi:5'-methylthioinosine phosphorylase